MKAIGNHSTHRLQIPLDYIINSDYPSGTTFPLFLTFTRGRLPFYLFSPGWHGPSGLRALPKVLFGTVYPGLLTFNTFSVIRLLSGFFCFYLFGVVSISIFKFPISNFHFPLSIFHFPFFIPSFLHSFIPSFLPPYHMDCFSFVILGLPVNFLVPIF